MITFKEPVDVSFQQIEDYKNEFILNNETIPDFDSFKRKIL